MTQRPYKILVVDDEPDVEPLFRQRMRRDIRAGRYELVFAHNGVAALERLNDEGDIDMVVTDINMPEMDGLTLLEQIPSVDPDVRSVIISAYGDMKNIRTAMNRGAFDFVTKPLDFDDLMVTIERTLRHLEEWREALQSRDKLVALQNELGIANEMQQSILPTKFPETDQYRVFASMEPARDVGGDFYDVIRLSDGQVGLAIADVSDKGVPAALMMMSSRTLLKGAAIGSAGPGLALREVNDLLYNENETGMFVTVFYAVYDPATAQLSYSNGGHNPPLIIHPDGSSELLPLTGGIALGLAPELDYGQNTVTLAPGDMALFYTDGVTEAMNDDKEEFGEARLQALFSGSRQQNPEETIRKVFDAVHDFAGDMPQSDDITCLTLYRSEAGS